MGTMPPKKVNNADAGDADHVGGNDWDDVADFFNNVDKTGPVVINTETNFRSGKFGITNPANTFEYKFVGSAITTADKNITLPLLTANDTAVTQAFAQTLTNKTVELEDNTVKLRDHTRVFKDGSTYYAISSAGAVVSSGSVAETVIQAAIDNASVIYIAAGAYDFSGAFAGINITESKDIYMEGETILRVPQGYSSYLVKWEGGIAGGSMCGGHFGEQGTAQKLWKGIYLLSTGSGDALKHLRFDYIQIDSCGWMVYMEVTDPNGFINSCEFNNIWGYYPIIGFEWVNSGASASPFLHNHYYNIDIQGDSNTTFGFKNVASRSPVFVGCECQDFDTAAVQMSTMAGFCNDLVIIGGSITSGGSTGLFEDNNATGNTIILARGEGLNVADDQLKIRNPANTFKYTVRGGAITANRNIDLPVITGTDTFSTLGLAQTITAAKTYNNSTVKLRNPADTFSYTLAHGAISADRTLNVPVITATDTLTTLGLASQTWTGTNIYQGKVELNKELIKSGVISPSQITSDQNDYAPTGLSTATIVRLDADSSFRSIPGLSATANQEIKLQNISANTILLKGQNTGSTAANRFDFGTGVDVPLFAGSELTLNYDNTTQRWRVDGNEISKVIVPNAKQGFYYARHAGNATDGYTVATAASGGSTSGPTAIAAHPSYVNFTLGTSTTGSGSFGSLNSNQFLLGNSWYWKYETLIRIAALSDGTNTYTLRAGFLDSGTAESVDGVFFRYTDTVNSGKWVLVARSNSSETTTNATNTAVAAATWYRLTVIVNPAGTSAEFFENGVSLGTVGTTIPTGAGRGTGFGVMFLKSAGTADNSVLDYDYSQVIAYSNVAT